MKVLLVALVLFVVAAYAQVRPRPSEVFEAEALLIVKRGNDTFHGAGRFFFLRLSKSNSHKGRWRVDQPDGKAREQFRFDIIHRGRMDYDFLQRYDLVSSFPPDSSP